LSRIVGLLMPQFPGAMSFDYAQDEVSLVMENPPHPERSRRILPQYRLEATA